MWKLDRKPTGMLTAAAVFYVTCQVDFAAAPIVVAVGVTGHVAAIDLAADAAAAALFVTRDVTATTMAQAVQLLLTTVGRVFVTVAEAFVTLGNAASAFITRRVGMSQTRAARMAGPAMFVAAEMGFTTLPILVAVSVTIVTCGYLTATLLAARRSVLDAASPLALHTVLDVIRRDLTPIFNFLVTIAITISAARE